MNTGPHHASDSWTVIFEVKGHKAELLKIEPGFHSYLGHEHQWNDTQYVDILILCSNLRSFVKEHINSKSQNLETYAAKLNDVVFAKRGNDNFLW